MADRWVIRTNDFKESLLSLPAIACERTDLVKNSLKQLLRLWGIALLCILIPVLHFVLVPGFLVLGLIFGYRALGYKFRFEKTSCLCPECKKEIFFKDLWIRENSRFNCELCGVQFIFLQKS